MRIVGYDLLGKEIFTAATHQQAADRAAENLPCVTHDTSAVLRGRTQDGTSHVNMGVFVQSEHRTCRGWMRCYEPT